MKFILYKWGSNSEDILEKNLLGLGHEVVPCSIKCEHYTKDLTLAGEMIKLIHSVEADAVISFNYYPIISMVCKTAGILYYSWVYDSPHYTLLAKTVSYDCNRIACFDGGLAKRLERSGINTVRHLPLGFDETMFDGAQDPDRYRCDVSFVGSLYTGKYNYYDTLDMSDDIRRYVDGTVEKGIFSYKDISAGKSCSSGEDGPDAGVETDTDLIPRLKQILDEGELLPGEDYNEDVGYIFDTAVVKKKMTVEERSILLTRVYDSGFDLNLYTGSDVTGLHGLNSVNKGYVDYRTQMPSVFKGSRINLNITLRSIETGIPLRALDIMGCGGFLLSNYQKELGEYFREGTEMVMFYDLDDCIEKIGYYLEHEEERKSIASAGRRAVAERFGFGDRLKELIDWNISIKEDLG